MTEDRELKLLRDIEALVVERDRLRAALAAAQAAGADDKQQVQAAAEWAYANGAKCISSAWEGDSIDWHAIARGMLGAIRALSPPASVETESEVMPYSESAQRGQHKTSPLSASAPAGAPSEHVTVLTPADVEAFRKACDATEPTVELRKLMALYEQSTKE